MRRYFLFIVAFGMRVYCISHATDIFIRRTKIVWCVNVVQVYIRYLRIFAVNRTLGPKLIMLKEMMTDLVVFISLFMIFLLGYGVTIQATLYPFIDVDNLALSSVFFRPFFALFGLWNFDEISEVLRGWRV